MKKYLMSAKTLDMWIAKTENNTYNGCHIEIDNSIPYGGVEHIEYSDAWNGVKTNETK